MASARTKALGHRLHPPRGWRENDMDGSVACPHRNMSVCPECAAANPEVYDNVGQHCWMTRDEQAQLNAMLRAEGIDPVMNKCVSVTK